MVSKKKEDKLEQMLRKKHLTQAELETAISSAKTSMRRPVQIPIATEHVKFGYFSDPHIGHKAFREDGFEKAQRFFKKENVDFIAVPGDHLEGMSGRPGHIYELSHVGFQRQIDYAASLYNTLNKPIFGIDGNHDQWYFKQNNGGVVVGDELEKRVKNYKHLGQDEGDIELGHNAKIKLFHANDGSAYASSYKLQKLIESLTGGDKPGVILSGHYHKSLYMNKRNVHGFECATLSDQSPFMRGKKIAADMGFGVVDLYMDKHGVERLTHTFVPIYSKNRGVTKYTKRL